MMSCTHTKIQKIYSYSYFFLIFAYISCTYTEENYKLINFQIHPIIKDKKKIRITDIARLAGVSIGTVDRVIHNRGEVSENTQKKILKIIDKVNFRPDILASSLASKKRYKFAILVPEIQHDSSFWNAPLLGIKKALTEMNHFGIEVEYLFFDQFDAPSFQQQATKILKKKPDAILFAPTHYAQALELAKSCSTNNIPFVLINSNIEEIDYLSYIGQDSLQSGYLSGKLMSWGLSEDSNILVINISKEITTHRHILKRNKGFVNYFNDHNNIPVKIHTINIEDTNQESVNKKMIVVFNSTNSIKGIFVSSSRVYKIANFIKSNNLRLRLIGYDLIDENIPYLEDGTIDFLISQKPVDQGYYGIMALLNHLVLKKEYKKNIFLPIDIITKENLKYYQEY